MSVPNQCSLLGRSAESTSGHLLGSFGRKIHGTSAIRTKSAINAADTQKRLSRLSLRQTSPHSVRVWVSVGSSICSSMVAGLDIADPRVDPRAEQVDEQVREHEADGAQRDEP